jgi:hypothetical protein
MIHDNVAKVRHVKVARTFDDRAVIESGLNGGERHRGSIVCRKHAVNARAAKIVDKPPVLMRMIPKSGTRFLNAKLARRAKEGRIRSRQRHESRTASAGR